MHAFLSFLVGASLTSFVQFLVDNQGHPFKKRSTCDGCGIPLRWGQLIPILSSLCIRKICRVCHYKPRRSYGVTELFGGIIFAITALKYTTLCPFLLVGLLILVGLHISLNDWRTKTVPVFSLFLLAILGGIWSCCFAQWPIAILFMGALLFLIRWIGGKVGPEKPLGRGDEILFLICGLWISVEAIPVFLFMTGCIGVGSFFLYQRTHPKTRHFPFAPAILMALWVSLIFFSQH
ncbi:MAG: A24 family peptidase [Alphaproteobacteria bacterium]|nr:A24 family peptidase [Alphaproteobacteria bacterium]